MTKEQKEKFIELAKQTLDKKVPAGYVYVGFGTGLGDGLGFGYRLISWNETVEGWKSHGDSNYGSSKSREYACPIEYWEKKLEVSFLDAAAPKPSEKTVKEVMVEFQEAQKLIGKEVTSKSKRNFIVDRVEFGFDARNGSESVKKHIDEHGYCISVRGGSYNVPLEQVSLAPVKVNGYEALQLENCYKFGCATIEKQKLRDAKALLEKVYDSGEGNRPIISVKIGTGDFTLDILNRLNLDQHGF